MTAEGAGSGWLDRLDEQRTLRGHSVEKMCREVKMQRASYYEYKRKDGSDRPRYPRDVEKVKAIATYLKEDWQALQSEMRLGTSDSYRAILELAANRDFNVELHRNQVRSYAQILGMNNFARAPSGVDVVVRLLRDGIAQAYGGQVIVAVRPVYRGTAATSETEPYQHQIYVVLTDLLAIDVEEHPATDELGKLREVVDRVLDGVLLPVLREHSTELHLPTFRGRADVLIYPQLLEMRSPQWTTPLLRPADDVLVTGIFYAGSPDVASLLAYRLGYGYAMFAELGRMVVSTGLRGLPDNRLNAASARVALEVLRAQSPTSGPTVWATDDPRCLLGDQTFEKLTSYEGVVVVLALNDASMSYGANRLTYVDADAKEIATKSRAERESYWTNYMARQQQRLLSAARRREGNGLRTVVHTVDLPTSVKRHAGGSFRDAVDELFDVYQATASLLADHNYFRDQRTSPAPIQ